MLEELRVLVMNHIHMKRSYADKWKGDIAPMLIELLEKIKRSHSIGIWNITMLVCLSHQIVQ